MTRIASFFGLTGGFAALACSLGLATAAVGAPASRPAPARAGLVVEVDPLIGDVPAKVSETHRSVHPDADVAFTRSTEGLELRINPDGSRRVDLRGRFRAYSVVTIAADGTITMACADDHASAIALARAAGSRPRAPRVAFGPREE